MSGDGDAIPLVEGVRWPGFDRRVDWGHRARPMATNSSGADCADACW